MSISAAIALATGLDPAKDFEVRNDGDGSFLAAWNTDKIPQPDEKQIAQWLDDYALKKPELDKTAILRAKALDYIVAIMAKDELNDPAKFVQIKADIAIAIPADPVVPTDPVDPVTP